MHRACPSSAETRVRHKHPNPFPGELERVYKMEGETHGLSFVLTFKVDEKSKVSHKTVRHSPDAGVALTRDCATPCSQNIVSLEASVPAAVRYEVKPLIDM